MNRLFTSLLALACLATLSLSAQAIVETKLQRKS